MPLFKFQLNLTYGLGGGRLKNFKMAAVAAISAQSDLRFGRRCRLKNFKMMTAI